MSKLTLTVGELIEALSAMNPALPVVARHWDGDQFVTYTIYAPEQFVEMVVIGADEEVKP